MLPLSSAKFHQLLQLFVVLAIALVIAGKASAQCTTPVANDDGPLTVHGPFIRLDPILFANDTGSPTPHLDIIGQNPSHGSLLFGDGTQIIYSVSAYTGPDSFTYRMTNSCGHSNFATVTLNVVNQAPIAVPDFYVIRARQQLLPGVLSNDFDPDSQDYVLFDVVIQQPTHGFLSLVGNGTDGMFYTPITAGTDSFTYKITDNLGLRSTLATVTLFVVGDGENDGVCSGCPDNGGSMAIGAPVNVSNGNMYLQENDYRLPSIGYGLSVTRTYNSDSQRIGVFGRAWTTAYDESICCDLIGLMAVQFILVARLAPPVDLLRSQQTFMGS